MMQVKAIGMMNFQAKFMTWSTRVRGSVPRIQMKVKMSAPSLRKNQRKDGMTSRNANVACHPPRKSVTARPLMANMPKYSAMKNVAYLKPEYSVIWPATISDSPSGTSKGVRFDSTRPEAKNRKKATAPQGVKTNQCGSTPNE